MEIEYLKLFKIDRDNNSVDEERIGEEGNVREYVEGIITQINDNDGDRRYEFKDTELTMKACLDAIISDNNRDVQSSFIANRLLEVEKDAQEKVAKLTDIQKGILLIAYCRMTDDEYKIIICKADYTEFLEEATGEKKNGLPIKKKIFKSFAANVRINAGVHTFEKIVTYDVNSQVVKYWYDTFLDLRELRGDEKNTVIAFDAIQSRILLPIKKKCKRDYLLLRNMTIAYFRSEGDFSIDYYADNILGSYVPDGNGLDMNVLISDVKGLPEKIKFDPRFKKVPGKISARMFKDTIDLSDEIELVLKKDIPRIENVIKAYKGDDGTKYIMILSDKGFDYAEGLKHKGEN